VQSYIIKEKNGSGFQVNKGVILAFWGQKTFG
jgi:hypothetical protein